jgi:hypothetical protein
MIRWATHRNPGRATAAPARLGPSGPATHARFIRATRIDGVPAYMLLLTDPGVPPATVWISRSTWLPVQSSSPGVSVSYEWTAPGTMTTSSLWPSVPAGLARIPPG